MSSVRKTMLRAAGFDVEVTRKQQKHMYVRLKPCAGGADATGGSPDARFRVCVSARCVIPTLESRALSKNVHRGFASMRQKCG